MFGQGLSQSVPNTPHDMHREGGDNYEQLFSGEQERHRQTITHMEEVIRLKEEASINVSNILARVSAKRLKLKGENERLRRENEGLNQEMRLLNEHVRDLEGKVQELEGEQGGGAVPPPPQSGGGRCGRKRTSKSQKKRTSKSRKK